jgi:DNA-directed RNA polymerase specialized sigma24 family protein
VEDNKWILGPEDGSSHPPLAPSRTAARPVDFETLYRRFVSRVNAAILAIVRDREEAAELTQEVFLRIHGACGAGRVPANVGPWIERLARTAAKRHAARKAARPEIPLGAMPFSKRADPRPWANLDELGWAA